jgi:hypothetical protein
VQIFGPNPSLIDPVAKKHGLGVEDFAASFEKGTALGYPGLTPALLGCAMTSAGPCTLTIPQQITTAQSAGITFLYYDNEAANANLSTPPAELADVPKYTCEAMSAIHAAGLKSGWAPTETILLANYAKLPCWSEVDLLDMQFQRDTDDTTLAMNTKAVAAAARAGNPKVIVLVQVNPTLTQPPMTVQTAAQHVSATRAFVDGMSVVATDPTALDQLLTAVGR